MAVDLSTIACHEAAHAVMRWLRGMPATELTADDHGGLCVGTGRQGDTESLLLVTLAGFAYEAGGVIISVDLSQCVGSDFDHARTILESAEWLRLRVDERSGEVVCIAVDDALQYFFRRASEMLFPYDELIEYLGDRLAREGRVSARSVAAMCREFDKRQRAER